MTPDLVGPQEIAQLLGVKRSTVDQWRWRNLLPEPDLVISGNPVWERSTITTWAERTGRPARKAVR